MIRIVLDVYDRFRKSPLLAWSLFLLLTAVLIFSVLTLTYKEDISDFLPLDEKNQTALSIYQDVSGADRIYAIVSTLDTTDVDPQFLADGVESFAANVAAADTLNHIAEMIKEVDMDRMLGIADEVYANIPYFLTERDYARIDSLLDTPEYIDRQLDDDRQKLLFPSSNVLASSIARDPLGLFTPVLGRLSQAGMPLDFDIYDGYILTPDGKKAVIMMESEFGAHESENNASLVSMLFEAADKTEKATPGLDIHIIGGPVIAVSNADRIKKDSILAISLAGILIMALLIYVFRNARNILLILVSVGWGWLFAMGTIALFYDSVSIIVIGIASVILGIAVNYPLHLIDHMRESSHPRAALREIISPLVVGNVTTVGAFLCLVPLDAPALHDLGLFSSLLLVGTILFVLLFLPQIVRTRKAGSPTVSDPKLITRLASVSIENNKAAVWTVLVLTVVFGYFSLRTEFDSDMRNINYMTSGQKEDMAYFQSLLDSSESDSSEKKEDLYVVSSGPTWEEALVCNENICSKVDSIVSDGLATRRNGLSSFLVSGRQQEERLARWKAFVAERGRLLKEEFPVAASSHGFSEDAFSAFSEILSGDYEIREFDYFRDFISTVFAGSISEDSASGRKSLVQVLSVPEENISGVKDRLSRCDEPGGLFFDVRSMNGSIADTLSDDFNYIGMACGCIVFVFLWISLGRIELAIVSFMPMAFSWIWILGIMGMLGMKFNIVNVILATFIFGQGDDYTIFMTEGLSYELAYRRRLLDSYKNSIIVSALIMFIGIGTLLFARHPALRSLGEVTVVGMLSVVLMAYLFPPLVFKWLVRHDGRLRRRPVTLKKIFVTSVCVVVLFLQLAGLYILRSVLVVSGRSAEYKRGILRRYICMVSRFDIRHMPGVKSTFRNDTGENSLRKAVIMVNHKSDLDWLYILALTPDLAFVTSDSLPVPSFVRKALEWSYSFAVPPRSGNDVSALQVRQLLAGGFSVVVFLEEYKSCSAARHAMDFRIDPNVFACLHGLDVVPVSLYGTDMVVSDNSVICNGGSVYMSIGERITSNDLESAGDEVARMRLLEAHIQKEMARIHREVSTVEELIPVVCDRYLYKGRDIEVRSRKILECIRNYSDRLSGMDRDVPCLVVDMAGKGELALILALMYPEKTILCFLDSWESRAVLEGCAEDLAGNIRIIDGIGSDVSDTSGQYVCVIKSRSDAVVAPQIPGALLIET